MDRLKRFVRPASYAAAAALIAVLMVGTTFAAGSTITRKLYSGQSLSATCTTKFVNVKQPTSKTLTASCATVTPQTVATSTPKPVVTSTPKPTSTPVPPTPVPPTPAPSSGSVPVAAATANWPKMDVNSLLSYELGKYTSLTSKVVNVTSYGAKGDGSTDSTSAVKSAIGAANGGTLYFPTGTYIIDSDSVPSGYKIRFAGDGPGKTILKHKDGSQESMIIGQPNVAEFEMENLTLDGNMAGGRAWKVSEVEVSADRVLINNIEAEHSIQQSIRLDQTTFTSVVENSHFHDFALHGSVLNTDTRVIQIDHNVASDGDVWLVNNLVEQTNPSSKAGDSTGGFRDSGTPNTRLFILKNTFKNMGEDWPDEYLAPIDIYRDGDGSVIWQNKLYNSYYTPIRVMRSNNVQVVDNLVSGEGHIGPDWGGGIDYQGRSPDVNMTGMFVENNTLENLPGEAAITAWFDSDGVMSNVVVDHNTINNSGGAVLLSYVRGSVKVTNNTGSNYGTGLQIQNANTSATQLTNCGNSWNTSACN